MSSCLFISATTKNDICDENPINHLEPETTENFLKRTVFDSKNSDINNTHQTRVKSAKLFEKIDRNLFTFQPKINPKSSLMTQNLLNFYERQNLHFKKQLEIVS